MYFSKVTAGYVEKTSQTHILSLALRYVGWEDVALFPASIGLFSFTFARLKSTGKGDLPWVNTHCFEHAWQLLSDRILV